MYDLFSLKSTSVLAFERKFELFKAPLKRAVFPSSISIPMTFQSFTLTSAKERRKLINELIKLPHNSIYIFIFRNDIMSLHIRLFVFATFLSGFYALPAQAEQAKNCLPAPPAVWTAEQAVVFALARNPDSHIVETKIAEAAAAAEMARAADYPSLDLVTEYGQTNTPMYSFGNILNQGAFDNSIDFNSPGRTDNLDVKAQVQYRLYNGGRDRATVEAAGARLTASRTDRLALHRRLAFEVVRAFHAIIQAEEMTEVRQASLTAISVSLDVAKARFEAGTLLQEELLNLELQQASATENLIQSRHAEELAKRRFLNLLGLPRGQVKLDQQAGLEQELPATISPANRQELRSLKATVQAAEADVQVAEAGRRPTVDSFASYQVDTGTVLDTTGDSWMAGVRMNYNIFDGRRTTAAITMAKAHLQGTKALLAKTELALDLEVQQAELEYSQAEQRLEVTEKMVKVAEETGRLSRERFKQGVILAIDLIDIETRLADAQARRSSAKAMHQVALANLRRAMGLPQFSESQDTDKEKE